MESKLKITINDVKRLFKNLIFLGDNLDIVKPLYKYMDVESAINFLQTRTLSFVEPSSWYDPFEKRFYNADFSAIPNFTKPKLFASCFTQKPTNEASWVMCSYFKNGLASKSIRLEFNPILLYDLLDKLGSYTKTKIVISKVNYTLPERSIKALHKKDSKYHSEYFNTFNIDKFINLMLIKRKAFEYEKELRIFITPTQDTPKEVIQSFENTNKIQMSGDAHLLIDLIKSIMISPNCTPMETEMIEKKVNEITNGIIKCKQSGLYQSFDTITIEQ